MFLDILHDDRATDSDRLVAAELAGDLTVMNDELAGALLAILRRGDASEKLRGQAAISLGPVLEEADTHALEDADDVPIAEHTIHRIQVSLRKLRAAGTRGVEAAWPPVAALVTSGEADKPLLLAAIEAVA